MIELQDPTLAGLKGPARLRKLEDSILNLQCQVLDKLDSIQTMQHEARQLREQELAVVQEFTQMHGKGI
jgi:hypothetical protein